MNNEFSEQDVLEVALELIRSNLAQGRQAEAAARFLELHPADQAEVYDQLSESEQDLLLPRLDVASTADLLEEMEEDEVLEAVEDFTSDRLADVLDEMEPDEAADLLGDLPPMQASAVLAKMEDADEVVPLLAYSDETAGGLMTTWYIAFRRHTTAEQAIQFLREVHPDTEVPYYLYVIDREKRLVGVVGLRQIVVAEPTATIESIMNPEVISVRAGADQEEAARLMSRYDLSSLPVVSADDRLLGIITHDDIVEVLEEEATEDIYALANVSDAALEPESPLKAQLKGRLPWVYVNMLTALFASWVITNFEAVIAEVAILAAFQSVVAGLGGNSASQNVAMMVRALALDKLDPKQFWRVITQQMLVGMLQGIAVGVVIGIGVGLWQRNPVLGGIIALAMVGNMVIAGIVGTVVPLTLRALKQDPAVASSVLVTAATDSGGFFIFLSLASLFLSHLN